MKVALAILSLILLSALIALAQSDNVMVSFSGKPEVPQSVSFVTVVTGGTAQPPEPGDSKDLPDYKLYKGGYNLILDEQWEPAQKKFAELAKQYPKSEYLDDARYWSAYAMMHIDKKKAAEDYKKFLSDFPHSEYFDDASSDLSQLKGNTVLIKNMNGKTAVASNTDSVDQEKFFVMDKDGKGYAYGYGPNWKVMERQIRAMKRVRLPRLPRTPMPALAPHAGPGKLSGYPSDVDDETRLRLEALDALGDKEDSASFRALRDIALNKSQKSVLRTTAMERLVDFRKFDPLPIFLQVAKEDTSEDIQGQAIEFVAMVSPDKNRSVESLIDLFNAIPKERADRRANVFYSIAEVGNDRAVDFLSSVARTDKNYDLRHEAIYYLGSIGSPRARQVLVQILQQK